MTSTQQRPGPVTGTRGEIGTNPERAVTGRGARSRVPRSVHGEWAPADGRPDPVSLLEEQATTRFPELVPLRYARMLVSPFTFYRGAAYLMASDLAAASRSGITVQLCGDAHLSNFGTYAAPDRRLVFSLNDFDETLPGPFEWDGKRLVASFAVAGRDRGFDKEQRERAPRLIAGGDQPVDSRSRASVSYPSAIASLGAAATTRAAPTTGRTPMSTSTTSAAPYEGTSPPTAIRAASRKGATSWDPARARARRRRPAGRCLLPSPPGGWTGDGVDRRSALRTVLPARTRVQPHSRPFTRTAVAPRIMQIW